MMPQTEAKVSDIAELSYEDAMAELERIVRQLESGQARLEDSVAAYKRGMALKKHCEARLNIAQAEINLITESADGSLSLRPLDPQ